MDVKPIRTQSGVQGRWKGVESLMTARRNTPEGDRLDVLATLIDAYERKHFPMDLPDAVEAIKFRMEQQGLTPKDIEPLIGRSNRVYEVRNRKPGLTLGKRGQSGTGPIVDYLRPSSWRILLPTLTACFIVATLNHAYRVRRSQGCEQQDKARALARIGGRTRLGCGTRLDRRTIRIRRVAHDCSRTENDDPVLRCLC